MPWPFFTNDDCADDDQREYLNNNCKEGVDPRSTWDDWGDSERDHKTSTQTDVGAPTGEETEEYYNELRPSGWWPL